MWWIEDREYPVDKLGVCCLCVGGVVAMRRYTRLFEGVTVEYPIMCVCCDERWSATPVDEMLETDFYGVE
jgi:hypothetical protein